MSVPVPLRWDLAGITMEVRAPEPLAAPLAAIWSGFESDSQGRADILARVAASGRTGGASGRAHDRRVEVVGTADDGLRVRLVEGRAEVAGDGQASIVYHAAESALDGAWAVHNLLLPVLAWHAARRRRGALVHGAAIVVDGRAWVLSGPEGSGKSTFAALAREAGVAVVGEDLVLLDGMAAEVEAVATPYRVEHATRRGPGRWPLAAILFPRRGPAATLAVAPELEGIARLAANLPYVAAHGDGIETARGIAARVPLRTLTFAPDPSFVDLLRRREGDGGPPDRPPGQ